MLVISEEVEVLVTRATVLYLPAITLLFLATIQKRTKAFYGRCLVATLWNAVLIVPINYLAVLAGFWAYEVDDSLFLGIPVDLWIGWFLLWGALPCFFRCRFYWKVLILLLIEIICMPLMSSCVTLFSNWFWADIPMVLICVGGGQFLFYTMNNNKLLAIRVWLHVIWFGLLQTYVLLLILQLGEIDLLKDLQISIWLQVLFIVSVPGLHAVQQFYKEGKGTPLPVDHPKELVSGGIYAYIANPMQSTMLLVFITFFIGTQNIYFLCALVVLITYSAGIATISEQELGMRFGAKWKDYCSQVKSWFPRFYPIFLESDLKAPAILYLDFSCQKCSQLEQFLAKLRIHHLEIKDATHLHYIERLTYIAPHNRYQTTGVQALADALNHTNLLWAYLGWLIKLPIISSLIQYIADLSGADKRVSN